MSDGRSDRESERRRAMDEKSAVKMRRPEPDVAVCSPCVMRMREGVYDVLASSRRNELDPGSVTVTLEVIGGCPFPRSGGDEDRCYGETSSAASIDAAVCALRNDLLARRAELDTSWAPKHGPTHHGFDAVVLTDLDGVVNHEALYALRRELGRPAPPGDWVDPACVARLDRVCAEGNAALVITSAWPIYLGSLTRTEEALRSAGLRAPIVGACPTSFPQGSAPPEQNIGRWRAISTWLEDHPRMKRWVIIDDCRWRGLPSYRSVFTELAVGMTDADADSAIRILRTETPTGTT